MNLIRMNLFLNLTTIEPVQPNQIEEVALEQEDDGIQLKIESAVQFLDEDDVVSEESLDEDKPDLFDAFVNSNGGGSTRRQ